MGSRRSRSSSVQKSTVHGAFEYPTHWLICAQVFLNEFKDRGVSRQRLRSWASCDLKEPAWADFAPINAGSDACAGAFGAKGAVKATAQTLALTTLVAMEM